MKFISNDDLNVVIIPKVVLVVSKLIEMFENAQNIPLKAISQDFKGAAGPDIRQTRKCVCYYT